MTKNIYGAMIGEFIGTGLIGSLLSYPVMVWFTGTTTGLFWFVYTPRFLWRSNYRFSDCMVSLGKIKKYFSYSTYSKIICTI